MTLVIKPYAVDWQVCPWERRQELKFFSIESSDGQNEMLNGHTFVIKAVVAFASSKMSSNDRYAFMDVPMVGFIEPLSAKNLSPFSSSNRIRRWNLAIVQGGSSFPSVPLRSNNAEFEGHVAGLMQLENLMRTRKRNCGTGLGLIH